MTSTVDINEIWNLHKRWQNPSTSKQMWNISIIQKQSTSRSFPRKTILQRPYWQSSEWTSILHYLANWCLQNTDLNLKQKSTTKWSIQRTDYPPHCGQIDGSKSMICPGRYHQERSSMKTFFKKMIIRLESITTKKLLTCARRILDNKGLELFWGPRFQCLHQLHHCLHSPLQRSGFCSVLKKHEN